MKMKLKFFEGIVLKGIKEFQALDTEDKERYITLYGHDHFSQWLASLAVQHWVIHTISLIAIILCIFNMAMMLFAKDILWMTVFFISFPVIVLLAYTLYRICMVWKMDEEKFKKWYKNLADRIQNLLFADYKIFSIWKRMYVKRIDKLFYKHLQTEECRGECYECSFKLAYLLNDPKVKILWFAATAYDGSNRYGHAVLERNGYILDTNQRKCYKKDIYLKAQRAEIFYEYSLEEYKQVQTPWDLKWQEFGKWCKDRTVQRNK